MPCIYLVYNDVFILRCHVSAVQDDIFSNNTVLLGIPTREAVEEYLEEADHAEPHAEAHQPTHVRDKRDRGRLHIPRPGFAN